MYKKVIALGNRLMMDDKIALLVVEHLQNILEVNGIDVLIGETDADFCFSKLNTEDQFYIIDSTCFGNTPGTITTKSLSDIKKEYKYKKQIHSMNLLDLISIYDINIKGYFIGIEISTIALNYNISTELKIIFQDICTKILKMII